MAKGLPYFKWYPADAETSERYASLTDQELGFYHHCLNRAWINDGLPSEPEELARMMRVKPSYLSKVWPRVSTCFVLIGDRYRNERQEEEREAATSKQIKCGESAAQQESIKIPGAVYLIRRSDGAVKIGSSKNVPRRLAQLRYRYKDFGMSLLAQIQVSSMGDYELELHARFKASRIEGEWFNLTDTEIGSITPRGDTQGDNANHPTPRALARAESVCESESSLDFTKSKPEEKAMSRAQAKKPGPVSLSFANFWARWCELTKRSQRKGDACIAWLSAVEVETESAAMACLERYGVSGDVARGVVNNPDKWIFEQARDEWQGDWPAPRANGTSKGISGEMERYLDEH